MAFFKKGHVGLRAPYMHIIIRHMHRSGAPCSSGRCKEPDILIDESIFHSDKTFELNSHANLKPIELC